MMAHIEKEGEWKIFSAVFASLKFAKTGGVGT